MFNVALGFLVRKRKKTITSYNSKRYIIIFCRINNCNCYFWYNFFFPFSKKRSNFTWGNREYIRYPMGLVCYCVYVPFPSEDAKDGVYAVSWRHIWAQPENTWDDPIPISKQHRWERSLLERVQSCTCSSTKETQIAHSYHLRNTHSLVVSHYQPQFLNSFGWSQPALSPPGFLETGQQLLWASSSH